MPVILLGSASDITRTFADFSPICYSIVSLLLAHVSMFVFVVTFMLRSSSRVARSKIILTRLVFLPKFTSGLIGSASNILAIPWYPSNIPAIDSAWAAPGLLGGLPGSSGRPPETDGARTWRDYYPGVVRIPDYSRDHHETMEPMETHGGKQTATPLRLSPILRTFLG